MRTLLVVLLLGCAAPPAPHALPSSPTPAAPVGDRTLIFRELLVGKLPAASFRTTWTLTIAGEDARLSAASSTAKPAFPAVDATTHEEARWTAGELLEYRGRITQRTPLRAEMRAGDSAFTLACADESLAVHPSGAALIPGAKNDDDEQALPTWSPASTTNVAAMLCVGEGLHLLSFTHGLFFAEPPVEWAFVNSGMVIQDGGFRFVPR